MSRAAPLAALCSEIGRGHPSYLDSVLTALSAQVPRRAVARSCTGLSRLAWGAVRSAYRFGGLGGPATWLYNRLRPGDRRPAAWQLSLLGSSLAREFAGYEGIVLVDHPLLAHILAGTCRVAYVHGEIAAPGSTAVPGAWRTFVPLESTARRLVAGGVKPEAVCSTGLIIEPELVAVAEAACAARVERLSRPAAALTVAFFTSGAYPRPHVQRIVSAAASAAQAGHRAVIFWGSGWVRAARAQSYFRRFSLTEEQVRPVWSRDRRSETERTARLFPEVDVMVAAAHERTNWAVGLGLPMFVLLPHIGPFAGENFAFASGQGVCLPLKSLDDARDFGTRLSDLRGSGRLAEMARAGWGRHAITGAESAARELARSAKRPGRSID